MARWKNYFSQLFKIHGVNDVRTREIQTVEPLVPETNAFEFELAIKKVISHKSPGIDQIPAKFIKTGGRANRSEILKLLLILYGKRRNCLRSGRSRSL